MNTPPPDYRHGMPPVPRDHDGPSFSELVPIGSRKISMLRSPLTLIALLSALAVPFMLFSLQQIAGPEGGTVDERVTTFKWSAFAAIFFFVMLFQIAIFFYARPNRSIMPFLWAFLFVFVFTSVPILFQTYAYPFRELIPLVIPNTGLPALLRAGPNAGFLQTFGTMFFAAGMTEELLKATPMLIGALVAWLVWRRPSGPQSYGAPQPRAPGAIASFFMIRGPLDGALMGIFAGGGFILAETGLEYVPRAADRVVAMATTVDEALLGSMALGLMTLLPRVISSFTGHMGYSALLGYLIGLGVIRRRHFWPIFLIGWVVVSAIHGMWNSLDTLGGSSVPYYIWGALSGLLAVAAILKGRQLHLSTYGEAPDTMGSVVIDRSGGGAGQGSGGGGYPPTAGYGGYPPATAGAGFAQPPPTFPPAPPPLTFPPAPAPAADAFPAPPQPPAEFAPQPPMLDKTPAEAPPAPQWPAIEPHHQPHPPTETFAANAAPPPAAAPPQAGDAQVLVLDISGLIIPIRAGALVDLGAEPALGGRGAGARAEVVPHPTRPNVLGLRNSGDRPWTAHLRDGRIQPIAPNQNVRLAVGVRIDFGDGLLAAVVDGT